MKILILSLAGIGDSLMFTPALKILRENLPDAEIHLLTMFPGANQIYAFNVNANKKMHFNFMKEGAIKSLLFLKKLRKEKYDFSINVYPMNRWEYNVISFLIGAKTRIGHFYNHQNIINLNFLHTKKIKENDNVHNVIENVRLLKFLGIETNEIPKLNISLPERNTSFAIKWLQENKIDDNDLIIGFHPGSSTLKNHINKRWLPENFASLGNNLIKKYNARILLFGGSEEKELRRNINKIMNYNAYIVETENLFETIDIMKCCKIFITNDTALMHIASALKLNIIAIFGPTSELYAYPWKTKHKIVRTNIHCRPCFYYSPRYLTCSLKNSPFACIRTLSVNTVLEKLEELLKEITN